MKLKVIVHEAEEGGFRAEVPAIPGCATRGESYGQLMSNVREAIEGRLIEHASRDLDLKSVETEAHPLPR
ncbi:MAG: type II toxin-antitoxin system HicB family antitoxin [Candidatus Acidiferrales bacterium]